MTAQQIADEIRAGEKILAEIVAGLDGVTPGPWDATRDGINDFGRQYPGSLSFEFVHNTFDDDENDPETIARIAAHIARCHPDALRSIAAAMQAKDARIAEVTAERDEVTVLYEKQGVGSFKLVKEAQARAEAAEAALAAMTAEAVRVLEPFASNAGRFDPVENDDHYLTWGTDFTIGHLRAARAFRAFLAKHKEGGENG